MFFFLYFAKTRRYNILLLFNFLWQRRKDVCLLKLLCVFGSLGLAIELHSLLLLLLLFLLLLLLLLLIIIRWPLPLVKPLTKGPNMPLN